MALKIRNEWSGVGDEADLMDLTNKRGWLREVYCGTQFTCHP